MFQTHRTNSTASTHFGRRTNGEIGGISRDSESPAHLQLRVVPLRHVSSLMVMSVLLCMFQPTVAPPPTPPPPSTSSQGVCALRIIGLSLSTEMPLTKAHDGWKSPHAQSQGLVAEIEWDVESSTVKLPLGSEGEPQLIVSHSTYSRPLVKSPVNVDSQQVAHIFLAAPSKEKMDALEAALRHEGGPLLFHFSIELRYANGPLAGHTISWCAQNNVPFGAIHNIWDAWHRQQAVDLSSHPPSSVKGKDNVGGKGHSIWGSELSTLGQAEALATLSPDSANLQGVASSSVLPRPPPCGPHDAVDLAYGWWVRAGSAADTDTDGFPNGFEQNADSGSDGSGVKAAEPVRFSFLEDPPRFKTLSKCPGGEFGRGWRWRPHAAQCIIHKFSVDRFCQAASGRSFVFIGDSLIWGQFTSLLAALGVPLSRMMDKTKPLNVQTVCADNHGSAVEPVQMRYVWSDYLASTASAAGSSGTKAPRTVDWVSLLSQAGQNGTAACNYDVVVLGTGAHLRSLEVYTKEIQTVGQSLASFLETCPGSDVIFRTSSPGIEHCWTYADEPITPAAVDWVRHQLLIGTTDIAYGPRQNRALNKIFKDVANDIGAHVLDVEPMLQLRPDQRRAEIDNFDCLHFCFPGPVDVGSELLQNYLMRLRSNYDMHRRQRA